MAVTTFEKAVKVEKLSLGLAFGFAVLCKVDGKDYVDLQDEHVPEEVMLKGASTFMADVREAKAMHNGEQIGTVLFAFPLTTEIAKALDIQTKKTGLLIAMKPNDEVLAKFASGEFTGFSIGGQATYEETK